MPLGPCCSSRYRRKLPLSISLPSKSAFRHVSAAILTSHHHQHRDFCFPYRMKFLLMTFFGPLDADKLNISKPHRGHSATTRVPSGRSICTLHPGNPVFRISTKLSNLSSVPSRRNQIKSPWLYITSTLALLRAEGVYSYCNARAKNTCGMIDVAAN